MKSLRILLAGIHKGQRKTGVQHGPKKIMEKIKFSGTVTDCIDQLDDLEEQFKSLCRERKRSKGTDLVIGGDHSLAIGSATATLKMYPDAKLLWIDAHADINTPETSTSGNVHGMPVAHLLGWTGKDKLLDPGNIIYVGVRDVDPKEQEFLDKHEIEHITSDDMHEDTQKCIEKINTFLGKDDTPIHISLDIDVLSQEYVPGTGTPVEKGLHPDQLDQILDQVLNRITPCIDLVEYNPELDQDERTSEQMIHVINKIMSYKS